jgi:hypothetical protein
MVSMQIKSDNLIIKPLKDEKLQRSVDFLYKPMTKKMAKEIIEICKDYILENN